MNHTYEPQYLDSFYYWIYRHYLVYIQGPQVTQ